MRIFKLVIYILIVFSLSYYVITENIVSYEYFIKTEFLFTFLGVFIGFALTLYTYLTSMFENMKKILRTKYAGDINTRDKKLELLPHLHSEIKDNIVFLIYALVIVVLISIFETFILNIDVHNLCIDIREIKNSVMLTIFILSIISLVDLVRTSFTISDFVIKN